MMTSSDHKTVVVLGKGSLAIAIADWFRRSADHDLHCVVPIIPEPTWTLSLVDWCRENTIPFVESGNYEDIPDLRTGQAKVDLVMSVYYGKIIKPWFFECVGRTLNLHNAPLPKYRGRNPINWALKNGEKTHGVSIHDMVAKVDAGPIVSQVQFTIDPQIDEVIDVYNRALAFGYTLFQQTIPALDRIQARPQNEPLASSYSRSDAMNLGDRQGFTRAESLKKGAIPKAGSIVRERAIDSASLSCKQSAATVESVPTVEA